ncbi:MAG TPA: hypothetical protein VNL77_02940 [Roseiflexaceae bacterium]|nr:hypothetical protein [Roseiflexaceae bacterium]
MSHDEYRRPLGEGARLLRRRLIQLLVPLLTLSVLFPLALFAMDAPTLTTGKPDYAPGEVVDIHGSGFAPNTTYAMPVKRPDGSIVVIDPVTHLAAPGWEFAASDADGNLAYNYQLDGIIGLYEARAYPADWSGDWSEAPIASVMFTDAPAANLDQCRNGSAASPNNCLDLGGSQGWANGNANTTQAHYIEGYSIPYRVKMTDLPLNTTITLDLGYDIKHSGKHAIDFLTHFDRLQPHTGFGHAAETVDPTSGVSGLSATVSTFPIPAPSSAGSPVPGQPTTRFNSLPAGERVMTLFGGTISNVQYVSQGSLTASQSETVIRVTFTVDSSTAVLAWGGHIARCADWGTTGGVCNSATGIEGSPYHMRLKDWNLSNLGNQDRSLAAGAVFPTGTVVINKVAVGGDGTFSYSGTGSGIPASFTITTAGGSGSQTFSDILTGAKTVTEGVLPADWTFTSLVCSDPDSGTTTSGQTANIDLDANETITCTYTNTRGAPGLTVTKTPSTTDVCAGTNAAVTYTYVVTNTGSVALTVNLSDDQLGDVDGGAGFTLNPGQSQTFTASTTINSTTTNTVTATGTSAGGQSVTTSATATVTAHTCAISLTKTPSVANVCDGANTQVTYTYVVTNTSDFFSVAGTVTDDVLGSIGSYGPLAPGASATLTKVATVNSSQTNTGTATGTFTDPAGTSASASASATVVGHACTISVTKTPSQADVCNGSTVEYTYTVTNDSDFFSWSGSLVDDVNGTIAAAITLTPGETQTFTASGTVTGTVTNTATASGTFDDASSTSASDSATATVTGHTCTISVTKTPSATEVCNGTNTSVTYTYVVTNNSDFYNVSGSVSDSELGSIGSFGPLAPGASATLTKSTTVNGTVTNTATATGTFDDPNTTSASASASATVTGRVCQIVIKKITKPTGAPTLFSFDASGTGYTDFALSDGQSNTQNLIPGTYTVQELVPLGWVLTGIGGSTDPNTPYNCTVTGSGGSTGVGNLNTQTVTIDLKIGDIVTCVFENTGQGVTRTQGFWATHPQLAQIAWFGGTAFGHTFPGVAGVSGIGDQLICGRPIDTLGKLMGSFWSDIPKKSTGAKRTALDQARMQLLQQLIAAELNASAFGSVPSSGSFAAWESALCGTNTTAIKNAQQQAASFNSAGDSSTFTPGTSADSKTARSVANIPFWDIIKP